MTDGSQVQERGEIVSTYLAPRLKQRLIALADKNERSLSAEIRLALKRHIATETEEAVA